MGAYAEARSLPETRLIRLPDGVSEQVAGATMLRGLTAHMLLFKVYPIKRATGCWFTPPLAVWVS
jgi:NADPH2:quinone reductase